MLEGKIIVPVNDNSGKAIPEALTHTITKLAKVFGGATARPASEGYWIDPAGNLIAEPVREVIVAYDEDDVAKDTALATIAAELATEADQHSVYVRYAGGEVALIEKPALAA